MIKNLRKLIRKKSSKRYFSINNFALNKIIDDNNIETRIKLKNIFKDTIFTPKYNISLDVERDLAYKRLKKICNSNILTVVSKTILVDPKHIDAIQILPDNN